MVWNNEKLLLGEVGAHGEWGETQLVGDVDGRPALHGHVEHLDVVEDHQDVGHRAPVDVLHGGEQLPQVSGRGGIYKFLRKFWKIP